MKILFAFTLLLILNVAVESFHLQNAEKTMDYSLPSEQNSQNLQLKEAVLEPGKGYSIDTQQVSEAICYNMQISKKSNSQSTLKLSEGSSYSDLVNTFGIDVKAKLSYAMFGVGASFSYLRSVQTTESSFSISYYHMIERDVSMNFKPSGILNDVGKMIYQDGNNPVFRLACGDQVITSYKQRASLVFTFNLNFRNKVEKETIKSKIGGSYGGIFSITTELQKVAIANHITGSMSLQVYQVGGDPRKLAQIISSKDAGGNYYILKCSLTDPTACNKTVSDLIDYSSNNFPNQISFDEDIGMANFGTNTIKYMPVTYFGIKMSDTFVTKQVNEARLKLSNLMEEYMYYAENLNIVVKQYPVEWVQTSQLFKFFNGQLEIAENNIKSLFNANNPQEGSQGCYSSPQRCLTIESNIMELVKPLNTAQLTTQLKQIKSKYSAHAVTIIANSDAIGYANGDNSWKYAANPANFQIVSISISNTSIVEQFTYNDPKAGFCNVGMNITSTNGIDYKGVYVINCQKAHETRQISKSHPLKDSEYFFDMFPSNEMKKEVESDTNKQ